MLHTVLFLRNCLQYQIRHMLSMPTVARIILDYNYLQITRLTNTRLQLLESLLVSTLFLGSIQTIILIYKALIVLKMLVLYDCSMRFLNTPSWE